jgi:hypothetical protein
MCRNMTSWLKYGHDNRPRDATLGRLGNFLDEGWIATFVEANHSNDGLDCNHCSKKHQ